MLKCKIKVLSQIQAKQRSNFLKLIVSFDLRSINEGSKCLVFLKVRNLLNLTTQKMEKTESQ